jgi:putative membrane protein
MIRVLRYVLLAILTVSLMVMASANRSMVTLNLLPDAFANLFQFNWQIAVPAYLVLFFGIVIGLLIGFVWEWLREYKHRRVASTKTREVSKLERELAAMKDQTSLPQDEVLAILAKPKAR